MPSQHQAT